MHSVDMKSQYKLGSLAAVAAMLLIVLVDGWAIAFLPRVVEKIVISAAFVVLVVVAVQELKGRDRQRA